MDERIAKTESRLDDLKGERGAILARVAAKIAELKRICAFPDDYYLHGSYSKAWERLGNSVPPVMMKFIAQEVADQIFSKLP